MPNGRGGQGKPLSITDGRVLALLDAHRVATTPQVAAALGLPVRTADYRLNRLREMRLVERHRPYAERGTAPLHWWLTRTGTALVKGERPGRGGAARPHPSFLAHTAAVTGLALALLDAPPDSGLSVSHWLREQDAWEHWRLEEKKIDLHVAPDGLLRGEAHGAFVEAFVEVDLGTMTQPRLRAKALRHLRYAYDRAWAGRHPWPPPLLLLTTSQERVDGFLSGVDRLRRPTRRKSAEGVAFAWHGAAVAQWVAACALVREPGRAVSEPVWFDAEGGPFTLADGLARFAERERRWAEERAAEQAREEAEAAGRRTARRIDAVRNSKAAAAEALGDSRAARAMARVLWDDSGRWRDAAGDPLGPALGDWWAAASSDWRPPPAALVAGLRERHDRLWREQAREALALYDEGLRGHAMARLAAAVAAGLLLGWREHDDCVREATRTTEWADGFRTRHAEGRARWVAGRLRAMRPWQRRGAEEALVAEFDAARLWWCRECGAPTPGEAKPSWDREPGEWRPPEQCRDCRTARLVPWAERGESPDLEASVAALRAALAGGGR